MTLKGKHYTLFFHLLISLCSVSNTQAIELKKDTNKFIELKRNKTNNLQKPDNIFRKLPKRMEKIPLSNLGKNRDARKDINTSTPNQTPPNQTPFSNQSNEASPFE